MAVNAYFGDCLRIVLSDLASFCYLLERIGRRHEGGSTPWMQP